MALAMEEDYDENEKDEGGSEDKTCSFRQETLVMSRARELFRHVTLAITPHSSVSQLTPKTDEDKKLTTEPANKSIIYIYISNV